MVTKTSILTGLANEQDGPFFAIVQALEIVDIRINGRDNFIDPTFDDE